MTLHRFLRILTLAAMPLVVFQLSAQTNVVTPALVEETKAKAEKGDAEAQDQLGFYYGRGVVVSQNYDESAKWYRKAADQGYAPGLYHLGISYSKSKGVPQDPAEAAKLVRRAAERGYAPAQYLIASWYASGEGVSKEMVEAHKWCSLAVAQGDTNAKAMLATLEKEMTPDQIAVAQQRAAAFKLVKGP